jgi:hypothetical protein
MVVITLGQAGDILNLLPVAYSEHVAGRRPTFIVSHEHAGLFDGITYCDHKKYSQNRDYLMDAVNLCHGMEDVRVAQVCGNPDSNKLESNYCRESYRLGGFSNLWRKYPLVFDRRDSQREQTLIDNQRLTKPAILVSTKGISSPFANSEQLINGLQSRFPDYQILDLANVQGERLYDLLGLMDRAACLVTIDTATLWLANAAKCPVVTLINQGWWGSTPPVTSIASFRYNDFQIDQVGDAVESAILPTGDDILVASVYNSTDRHKKAQKTWKIFDLVLTCDQIPRNAHALGDSRPLPMLKEMLAHALKFSKGRDVIYWTNDDVQVLDIEPIKTHCGKFGAVGIRRHHGHYGRELFAFRWDWLADRIHNFPDVAIAAPWFDAAVAAWIRQEMGIVCTIDNLMHDYYPAEIYSDGLIFHEDHTSGWADKMGFQAAVWNHHIYGTFIK